MSREDERCILKVACRPIINTIKKIEETEEDTSIEYKEEIYSLLYEQLKGYIENASKTVAEIKEMKSKFKEV